MKVLIAVKGTEAETFYQRIVALGVLAKAEEILLAHVIDVAPRAGLELGRERYLARRPLGEQRSTDLALAEEEASRAALQFGRQTLLEADVPEAGVREVTLRGKPNEELRELAEREHVGLIVVGGRASRPGLHSIGKTARFLIDHGPHAVLLVR
jgi:nucleotide-binding universal stress UspA family protein